MRYIILILTIVCFGLGSTALAGGGYVCWSKPTEKAKNECKSRRGCNGAGVYAWHPKKTGAEKLAIKTCEKEFGMNNCVLEYCEKQETK